jgi:multidrug efflux pump subunit AcrA (membrane-fusion protein)
MEMLMRNDLVLDLNDCTEFRQALQARPPRIVHGTTGLLVALLGTALAWSAGTRANLVVLAPGRVRPVTTPTKVYVAARGEVLGTGVGGRVVEIHAREGDRVKKGDLLIRLETERLDNEITKQTRMLRDAQEELAHLGRLEDLTTCQLGAARARAAAELAQARAEVLRAEGQQEAEVRLVQVELDTANQEERQLRVLVSRQAAPRADLTKAELKGREAREKMAKVRLPLDWSRVTVAERALELVERDHAVKLGELRLRSAAKRGEVEATRIELATRELERQLAEIRSPIDGVVIKGDVKVGDIVEPGKPVVELAQQGGFVFEASVSSEDIGHLRAGMAARIKLDAFDYQRYGTVGGTVRFLSPDSGVAGEGGMIKYTVRVALASDEVGRGEFRGRVRLGMTGQAEIVTGHESVLSLLVKRIRQTIRLG